MKLKFYRDYQKQWRWRVIGANGKKVATSGEGYYNFSDALRIAERVVHPDIVAASYNNIQAAREKAAKTKPRKVSA